MRLPFEVFRRSTMLLALIIVVSGTVVGSERSARSIAVDGVRMRDSSTRPGASLDFLPYAAIDTDGNDLPAPDPATVASPDLDPSATCAPGLSIGSIAAMTGHDDWTEGGIIDGAALAVDEFNAAHPHCQLTMREFDTESKDLGAASVAGQIAADSSILGIVGPIGTHDVDLVGDTLSAAGVVFALPSVTNPSLSNRKWTSFFRGVSTDADTPVAAARFITRRMGLHKVCVVHQDLNETTDVAAAFTKIVGPQADRTCAATVGWYTNLYGDTVAAIEESAPDAVFFAGYGEQSAGLVTQLRSAGVGAAVVGWEGVMDIDFIQQAGQIGRGTYAVSTFQPILGEFEAKFRQVHHRNPHRYTLEAYELATIMVNGIASGRVVDRASMLAYFRAYHGYGAAREYSWNANGELATPPVWMWAVS
jgi:branched-chain amino acid transport system substrate-binding protein